MEKRYLYLFVGFFALPLLVITALNLRLGERALGNAETVREASAWQQATRGITYAPPVVHSRPFKSLRLADRTDVDTLVLGASSLMGVSQAMFPAGHTVYNFALTANQTPTVTGEAEYFARHYPRVRTYVIGLDWSIPALYQAGEVPALDLSPAAQLASYVTHPISLPQRVADAVSLPRVQALGKLLRDSLHAAAPLTALRDAFSAGAGAPYACADGTNGTIARDFDVTGRSICLGFRHDGSWTFAGEQHLSLPRAQTLARAAAAPSSKFVQYACTAGGEPNAAVLARLGAFAHELQTRGGQAVFVVPPLLPGMVNEMQKNREAARCLARTYDALEAWARAHRVVVVDAAPAERYGCTAAEFLDENHAWPECLARVLARYWALRGAGTLSPGLYRPPPVGAQ